MIAGTLRIKSEEKQELLEERDVAKRLLRLSEILAREQELVEIGSRIQTQVQPLNFRNEIVLVARTAPITGRAQQVNHDGGTASRLWIDALPDGASECPKLEGYLTQETYLRAYVPVRQP